MNKVTVNKKELLEAIKANRDSHYQEFTRAQRGFRDRVITELDRRLEDARNGRPINLGFSMPEPQNHTQDYDRVIRMLEMSLEDNIEIESHEFDQYVMDNWSWSHLTRSINASYVR